MIADWWLMIDDWWLEELTEDIGTGTGRLEFISTHFICRAHSTANELGFAAIPCSITLLNAAEEIIAKNSYLKKMDDVSGKEGFKVMLIARLVPYLPSGLLNAVGALSKMSLKDYVLAALIGKLPSTAIEAMIGHDAVTASENPYRLVFNIFLAVAVIGAFFIYEKRNKAKAEQEKGQEN